MYKSIIGSLFALLFMSTAAMATCLSYPYTLTNGTTANASQVMANFNCAALTSGATIDSTIFTGLTTFPGSTQISSVGSLGIGVTPSPWTNVGFELGYAGNGLWSYSGGNWYVISGAYFNSGWKFANAGIAASFIQQASGIISFQSTYGVSGSAGGTAGFGEMGRFGSDGSFLAGTSTNGGWNGNSKMEAKVATGQAISAYATGVGSAFLARLDNTGGAFANFYYTTSNVGSITTNGTNTTYSTSSDKRLKSNIVDLDAYLSHEALIAYRPQDYLLRGKYGVGAVAQDVSTRMADIGIDASQIG